MTSKERAIIAALNFAGLTISSSDGTYENLILVITDAIEDCAKSRIEEQREAYAKMIDQEASRLSGEMLDYRMLGRDIEAQALSVAGARLEKIAAKIRAQQ